MESQRRTETTQRTCLLRVALGLVECFGTTEAHTQTETPHCAHNRIQPAAHTHHLPKLHLCKLVREECLVARRHLPLHPIDASQEHVCPHLPHRCAHTAKAVLTIGAHQGRATGKHRAAKALRESTAETLGASVTALTLLLCRRKVPFLRLYRLRPCLLDGLECGEFFFLCRRDRFARRCLGLLRFVEAFYFARDSAVIVHKVFQGLIHVLDGAVIGLSFFGIEKLSFSRSFHDTVYFGRSLGGFVHFALKLPRVCAKD